MSRSSISEEIARSSVRRSAPLSVADMDWVHSATDPAAWRNAFEQGNRTVLTGTRGGVDIRVVVDMMFPHFGGVSMRLGAVQCRTQGAAALRQASADYQASCIKGGLIHSIRSPQEAHFELYGCLG